MIRRFQSALRHISNDSQVELVRHPIPRISYVMMDPEDVRVLAYIFNTNDGRHQFWAIKMERPAHSAVLVLKGLFDEMFQCMTDEENKRNEITLTSVRDFHLFLVIDVYS